MATDSSPAGITADRRLAPRIQATLWLVSAAMTVMGIASKSVDPAAVPVFVLFAVGGVVMAGWMWAAAARVSVRALQAGTLAATLVLTVAAHFPGHASLDCELVYLWMVLYAFLFFSRRFGVVQIAVIATAYAALLAVQDPGEQRFVQWMHLVGTAAGIGFVITVLKARVGALVAELHETSVRDALTRIANRRGFEAAFEPELERASRHGRPLAILLLDVDHFKKINDVFGHDGGDEALRHIAATISGELRASDLVGRWGGEEFAVLLPETRIDRALEVAERVRASIAGSPHPDVGRITVSTGVAAFPAAGSTCREVLRQADGALYAAKRDGRNCVRRSGGEDLPELELELEPA